MPSNRTFLAGGAVVVEAASERIRWLQLSPHCDGVLRGGVEELLVVCARGSRQSARSGSLGAVGKTAATALWAFVFRLQPRHDGLDDVSSVAVVELVKFCIGVWPTGVALVGGDVGVWEMMTRLELGEGRVIGRSGASLRRGRSSAADLGSELHGVVPRSTRHRDQGLGVCAGPLLRLSKPLGDGAARLLWFFGKHLHGAGFPAADDGDSDCRDLQELLCFFLWVEVFSALFQLSCYLSMFLCVSACMSCTVSG